MALPAVSQSVILYEASGVYYDGAQFLIVDNEEDRTLFSLKLADLSPPKVVKIEAVFHSRLGDDAEDLEAIGKLADGRIVVLSEDNQALVSKDGIVAKYSKDFKEARKVGLEGLALKHLSGGDTQVAVVYEGGYMNRKGSGSKVYDVPRQPKVLVHIIKKDEVIGDIYPSQHAVIALDVPYPDEGLQPPKAQRYRVPDIVWDETDCASATNSTFIALLSSRDSPRDKDKDADYKYKCLHRFDINGRRIGEPLYLSTFNLDNRINWEGLAWVVPGKSLVLVGEKSRGEYPTLAIVDVSNWTP